MKRSTKNKIISIIVISIFLLGIILCLKITLIEYFSNIDVSIKKLSKSMGFNLDLTKIEEKCGDELNNIRNDEAAKKLISSFESGDLTTLSLLDNFSIPKSVQLCLDCIEKNNILDTII